MNFDDYILKKTWIHLFWSNFTLNNFILIGFLNLLYARKQFSLILYSVFLFSIYLRKVFYTAFVFNLIFAMLVTMSGENTIILLTMPWEKYLHGYIISLRGEVWGHNTTLTVHHNMNNKAKTKYRTFGTIPRSIRNIAKHEQNRNKIAHKCMATHFPGLFRLRKVFYTAFVFNLIFRYVGFYVWREYYHFTHNAMRKILAWAHHFTKRRGLGP
jgi:hypothetical protein